MSANIIRNTQHNFEDVCNTILYSENQKEIDIAYDAFFGQYREAILQSTKLVALSCTEDVIFKILESSAKSDENLHGKKYSPYSRLVALAKKQNTMDVMVNGNPIPITYQRAIQKKFQIFDLNKMLLFADTSTDEELNIKNKYLQSAFHKKYFK